MAIRVTCPGCHKRFRVSDQFAGKSGPCPQCKAIIRVPTKDEEVKIHGPEGLGAGVRGVTTAKPIARIETKLSPVAAASISAATLVVLIVTAVLGHAGFFQDDGLLKSAIGLLLVSPPLVIAGYSFLRDDEDLSPYRGLALYVRAGICSAAYMALWGIYAYVAGQYLTGELWTWVYVAPPFFVVGGLAALASLDLDFGSGFFHYCFYLAVTVLLRFLAGMGWVWEIPEKRFF
ncbi:MAG: hypothetical protein A2V98_19715 [Planctomycetes bacterium RBG_16_64_12]|nr:MAG: hypothetical protein A2V98_19715 [Planctomycetes bacterium RBG_16_64_12]